MEMYNFENNTNKMDDIIPNSCGTILVSADICYYKDNSILKNISDGIYYIPDKWINTQNYNNSPLDYQKFLGYDNSHIYEGDDELGIGIFLTKTPIVNIKICSTMSLGGYYITSDDNNMHIDDSYEEIMCDFNYPKFHEDIMEYIKGVKFKTRRVCLQVLFSIGVEVSHGMEDSEVYYNYLGLVKSAKLNIGESNKEKIISLSL